MKIISIPLVVLLLLSFTGCSIPARTVERPLYSILKEEKITKSAFGRKKTITIKDFRGNEAYDEDIERMQKEAEVYISQHPNLSDTAKNNLRELKVTQGSTSEEVNFLLGKPDKIVRTQGRGRYGASEIWIYRINKIRLFTVFILPVFPVREGYYLYFRDGTLVEIEKHYLKQTVQQGAGPGVIQKKS